MVKIKTQNMKSLTEYIQKSTVNEYFTKSNILARYEETQELADIIEAGVKATGFNLNSSKNRFHLVNQILEDLRMFRDKEDSISITLTTQKPNK